MWCQQEASESDGLNDIRQGQPGAHSLPATSFQLSDCGDIDISITAWSQGERSRRKGLAWPEVAFDLRTRADKTMLG